MARLFALPAPTSWAWRPDRAGLEAIVSLLREQGWVDPQAGHFALRGSDALGGYLAGTWRRDEPGASLPMLPPRTLRLTLPGRPLDPAAPATGPLRPGTCCEVELRLAHVPVVHALPAAGRLPCPRCGADVRAQGPAAGLTAVEQSLDLAARGVVLERCPACAAKLAPAKLAGALDEAGGGVAVLPAPATRFALALEPHAGVTPTPDLDPDLARGLKRATGVRFRGALG